MKFNLMVEIAWSALTGLFIFQIHIFLGLITFFIMLVFLNKLEKLIDTEGFENNEC